MPEPGLFRERKEVVDRFAESDEGSLDHGAGLLGGGQDLARSALQVKVRVGAGFPPVGEEVAVKFVSTVAGRVGQGEAVADFGGTGRGRPTSTRGRSAVLPSGEVSEVGLEPAEQGEKDAGHGAVVVGVESPHRWVGRCYERLVGVLTGGSGVDEVARFDPERGSAVDAAFPADAGVGEAMPVFLVEEGFGATVSDLLLEVFPGGGPAVVPNEGGGGEAEGEAGVAQPPTEVDVVACRFEDWIEAADFCPG